MGRGSGLLVEIVAAEAGQLSERQRWGTAVHGLGQGSTHPVSVPREGEAADALCEVLSRLKWRRKRFTGQTVQTTPE